MKTTIKLTGDSCKGSRWEKIVTGIDKKQTGGIPFWVIVLNMNVNMICHLIQYLTYHSLTFDFLCAPGKTNKISKVFCNVNRLSLLFI
jgi:hypothetical protein